MILTILILLPLVGALVTAFSPAAVARLVGLGFAAATLLAGVVAAVQYEADAGMQLTETTSGSSRSACTTRSASTASVC